jgi:thioredoxin-dependent peroxiredoxin
MRTGDTAPDLELPDQTGVNRKLSEIAAGRRTVLFFYPGAMTTGCTKESCHFRDLAVAFDEVSAVRVGISMDTVDKQREFDDHHSLGYPLLSDADGAAARAFGVKRALNLLKVKRSTFVLDEQLRVLDVINSETNMNAHADRALSLLAATPAGGGSPN